MKYYGIIKIKLLPENPFITKTGTLLGSKKLKIF